VADQSLYDKLGVSRSATPKEIKAAYKKLARKFHPDVNPGDAAAEERFKEASAAHEVLSDPEKRKLYDEFGEDAAKVGFDPEQARAYRRWQAQAAGSGGAGYGFEGLGGEVDLGDLFGDLLGGRGAGPRRPRRRRGADIEAVLSVSLEEVARGGTRSFRLQRPERCGACSGRGSVGAPLRCPTCEGTGGQDVAQGPMRFRAPCQACGGSGERPGAPCGSCGGQGVQERSVTIEVKVPAGVEEGQRLRLSGQGAAGLGDAPSGDLYVELRLAPHPVFRREGRDLHFDLPLTIQEALLGATVAVPTLDEELELKIPAGSSSGRRLRLRGQGLPEGKGRRGDLYAVLQIRVPKVTPANEASARAAAEALESLYTEKVRRDSRRPA